MLMINKFLRWLSEISFLFTLVTKLWALVYCSMKAMHAL